MSAIPSPGLGGHDGPQGIRDLDRHYADLADAANSAESRQAYLDRADRRTAPARYAIKALAKGLTEAEACALIASVQNAIAGSGFGHTDAGEAARESLTDAHCALEQSNG